MSERDNLPKAEETEEIKKNENSTESVENNSEVETKKDFDSNETTKELINSKVEGKEMANDENHDDVIASTEDSEVRNPDNSIQTLENTSEIKIQTDINKKVKVQDSVNKNVDSKELTNNSSDENHDDVINEIEDSNAEDAEDEGNKERHTIEVKEYDSMSLEALTIELEKLLKNEKIQAIRSHVAGINEEFKTKFQALLDEKKEDFINDGGNEIDFFYSSSVQKRYKNAYKEYRNKLNDHYKSLEKNLKQNLADKLEIIEELKGLINLEENINTTYKHFKELQERWRNTGPIPRDKYNNAWNSYHHHVEIFYDFLHLNRDLRDLDFKHNLEKKLLIIERAEELAKDDNIMRSFRELQELHKMWKEELGPVDREYREDIWNRFKAATKTINDKRQDYYKEIDKVYEKNLEKKLDIIARIEEVNTQDSNSHGSWQKKMKEIEALRDAFFNAGKVPIKLNETTWTSFKDSVRTFNKKKNAFYKGLKKEQYENLQKKLELIKIAEDNKDSEDYEVTTALMKKIQSDWKKIGHVPRKDSDKIWKKFKSACNHYFDKLHATRNATNKETNDAFNNKQQFLDDLKTLKLSGKKEKDLETIKQQVEQWKSIGKVPNDKRYIEGKFNKALDELFSGMKIEKNEVEMIKYEAKLEDLSNTNESDKNLDNERFFIRKKIDELKGQINQLENNLQFFTNVDDDNPLVKEVHNNIKDHKQNLKLWKSKLSKIRELY